MAKTLTVTARRNITGPHRERAFKGETLQFGIDFKPWAEDNGDIALTGATWTVKSGTATVSGTSFAGNAGQANIALPESGRVLIEIDATDGTLTKTIYLEVLVVDPEVPADDYGAC